MLLSVLVAVHRCLFLLLRVDRLLLVNAICVHLLVCLFVLLLLLLLLLPLLLFLLLQVLPMRLGLLPARFVLRRRLQGVEGHCCICRARDRGLPEVAVVVLEEVEVLHHGDLQQPQAMRHVTLLKHLVRLELLLATVTLLEERLKRRLRKHLDGSEHKVRVSFCPTVRHQRWLGRQTLRLHQVCLETLREEHGIWIHLHNPIAALVTAVLPDLVPNLQELQRVWLGFVAMSSLGQVGFNDGGLKAHRWARAQPRLDVTVHRPFFATVDAGAVRKLLSHQGDISVVRLHDDKAEQGRCRQRCDRSCACL
mmetsp:Transcript_105967/g.265410  ORF Transcript_105967/g.265410 Transcript_105967/m.265410 type:complete len:308 (+) Transcript_105967:315-1238(+)